MPGISIIVPVYNVEKYLQRCIESILAQTFTDFELILIDDGSPDNSGKICDEYAKKDSRIKVIHQRNSGVSAARNAGLDLATGEYVTFIDSDDYVDPEYLSVLWNPESDMCICGHIRHMEDGSIGETVSLQERIISLNTEELLWALRNGYLWAVRGKLFRRKLIEAIGLRFREDICHAEDSVFSVTFIKHCKILSTFSAPRYHYIKYDEPRLTNSISEKHIHSYDVCFNFYREWLNSLGVENDEILSSPALKGGFIRLMEDQKPYREKKHWYKLYFKTDGISNHSDLLFPEYSSAIRFLIRLRSPLALHFYLLLSSLKGKLCRKF